MVNLSSDSDVFFTKWGHFLQVEKIVNSAIIDPEVYIGRRKLVAADSNFMSENDIIECVKQIINHSNLI